MQPSGQNVCPFLSWEDSGSSLGLRGFISEMRKRYFTDPPGSFDLVLKVDAGVECPSEKCIQIPWGTC